MLLPSLWSWRLLCIVEWTFVIICSAAQSHAELLIQVLDCIIFNPIILSIDLFSTNLTSCIMPLFWVKSAFLCDLMLIMLLNLWRYYLLWWGSWFLLSEVIQAIFVNLSWMNLGRGFFITNQNWFTLSVFIIKSIYSTHSCCWSLNDLILDRD
jgi:hypothetical protein